MTNVSVKKWLVAIGNEDDFYTNSSTSFLK